MEQKEIKYLADPATSGLNADDADFSLGQNQVVNAENVRWGSTDAGVVNVVESVGSTLLLSSPQPSVSFITIGSVADTARNRIFYFQCDKFANNHKIVCYDNGTFYDVLLSSQVTGGLDFNKNYVIHSAKIIGDLLYWTDNYNEPRRINTEAAIKLNNPSYDTDVDAYTSPLAQSVITLIRRPPGVPPVANPVTLGGVENFIKQFCGQFAIRYVYRDGEYSVIGQPSSIVNYRLQIANFTSLDNADAITVELNQYSGNPVELIEQDVQIVQFLVRRDNNPNYFVIKEWNKDNPTEAAEIAAYNAGGVGDALSYTFLNDKIGVPIDTAASIKPFDNVPNLSETLEIGQNRLFLGNNTKGYDTPAVTSLSGSVTTSSATLGDRIFKSFSSYQIGIRFRDNYKRACGVVTSPDLVIEIPDRGDYNTTTGFVKTIDWALSNTNALNEIPDWAYYYDILITKCLRTRYYTQWLVNAIKYAVKNIDGTYTYQNTYTGSVYGVAIGVAGLFFQGMGVSYTEGDQVRLYFDTLTPSPVTLAVIAQDADYVIVSPRDFGDTTGISFLLAEYYTPYLQAGVEPFYTTGYNYKVNAPGTDSRQYSSLSGSIQGDSYFISRLNIFATTYYTEAMSPNDNKWKDWFSIYGEFNIVTALGREVKESSVVWSDTFLQGTNTNGLSSFDALDEKLLPQAMGALRKLQNTSKIEAQGGVMLAICEDETASMYLGEVQTYGSDQRPDQVLAVDNIIGTINVLKGSFGTRNPESVVEYRGNVFWFDSQNGRVIQYGGNGLFPISNYKMTRFWKLFSDQYNSMTSAEIEDLGDRPFVFMTVDPYHDEVLVSIPKLLNTPPKGYLPDYPSTVYPFDIWDGLGKTIVFDLKSEPNKWMGSYSFVTENFVTLQNKLYSFKNGQLYEHNQTTSFNEFYGTQNKSKVMFVSNQQPNQLKVYNNISIQNNTGNLFPSLTYFYVDNPYQQASDLMDFDWTNLEGVLYTTLYRNKLVPTAIGYNTNGLLTAEKIRTNALKVLIQWDVTTVPLQLRFVTLGYIESKGHNQVKF